MCQASNVPPDLKTQFEGRAGELSIRLFGIVFRWTLDEDLASDITQEAFTRFISRMNAQNWSQVIESIEAFLTTIARNILIDLQRQQAKRRFESLDNDADRKLHKEVDQILLLRSVFTGLDPEQLEKLREKVPEHMIFRGFSDDDLELLKLHKIEGLTPKKIATQRGEDADKLRYRLTKIEMKIRYRARQSLKATGKKSLF
jgi:RNA polymerase sigma factor (sigma-70 family)